MKLNYNVELKKFREKEENREYSIQEARKRFKPFWEKMKESENSENSEIEINEENEDKNISKSDTSENSDYEKALKFYHEYIKGKTAFSSKVLDMLKTHYHFVVGEQIKTDLYCSSCLSRVIKRFKKKLNV